MISKSRTCCKAAQLYGMLLFSQMFSSKGVMVSTENVGVRTYVETLLKRYGIECEVTDPDMGPVKLYVTKQEALDKLFGLFFQDSRPPSPLRIDSKLLQSDCCRYAFLSGILLACGSMTDPENAYHLEFETPYRMLTHDLHAFLTELGYPPKKTVRASRQVIYYKDSGAIEDILGLVGATKSSIEMMNIKIYKDLRNNANRAANCDSANIAKTVRAAVYQTECIERLKSQKRYDNLPLELKELAQARLDYPEYSLSELAAELHLSKSGVTNRMKRLVAFSESPY